MTKKNKHVPVWRLAFVFMILAAIFSSIVWRVVILTNRDKDFLQSQGDARSLRDVSVPAYRGMLLDRYSNVLAVSTPVLDVWLSPKDFKIQKNQLLKLANILKLNSDVLIKKIKINSSKHFLYLKRSISPAQAKKIKTLKIPGISLQKEYKRFYPLANVLSGVIGFNNIDDQGIEGLELAFNSYLTGEDGIKRVIKDRLGHVIDDLGLVQKPKQGQNIHLTIDKRIQYVSYRALKETVNKFDARSGSIVVIDPNNGELLAMANYPSFNSNKRLVRRNANYKNRAVTDLFEPGSVMKAFSVASALDSGLFTPATLIDTNPSWMMVDGNTIRDDRAHGVLSVTQVMKRSSNVGVTKMVLSSPASQLDKLLRRVGFGKLTGSGFPGETAGSFDDKTYAPPFVLATLGFGYGMSATTIQLAQAYGVFANGGYLMPARFTFSHKQNQIKAALSKNTSKEVLEMLEAVVEENGTGRHARVNGYRVAGKTGTSRIAGKNGYDKNRHIASFVGISPVSKAKLVIAVVIREPHKISYYGGTVAAPLFAKVMSESLHILGIAPDKTLV